MTIADAIRQAADQLAAISDTARLDAELLMAHALGVTRSDMLLRAMQDEAPEDFVALVERRARHEPVAYIVGRHEFFGLPFKVTSDVLVPRGDSEVLVEAALELSRATGRVVDLGTGSGALLLAFLSERPAWRGTGIDASSAALEIATFNAAALGLSERSAMQQRNWRHRGWADDLGQFDLVLCNPPYVEDGAEIEADVRDFEPPEALFSGPEGLDDYRILIPQMGEILAPQGTAIFEIGHKQAAAVSEIAASNRYACEIRRDLGGRPRVAILTRGLGKVGGSV